MFIFLQITGIQLTKTAKFLKKPKLLTYLLTCKQPKTVKIGLQENSPHSAKPFLKLELSGIISCFVGFMFWLCQIKLIIISIMLPLRKILGKTKGVYPKYSKHWPFTVAHTIDCVCSKMLNHGLNHGLFLLLFKFFGWKYILNWIKSGLKFRFLFCVIFQFYLMYRLIARNQPIFCLPKWLWWAPFFKCL